MSKTAKSALSIAFLLAITLLYQGIASAACGTEYTTPIAITPHVYSFFPANESSGVLISASIQRPWCASGANYLCYNSSSSYDCYLDDTKVMTLIDEGQGTDFNREALDPSLVLWMNMSGSGDDASLYRFTSTSSGNIDMGEGVVGYGMNFHSGSPYYDFGDEQEHDGDSSLTVMGWVWSNGTQPTSIASKLSNSPKCGWEFYAGSGDSISQYFEVTIGGTQYAAFYNYIYSNTWNHVAATYDGETVNIYVNGTLVTTDSSMSGAIDVCSGVNLLVGGGPDTPGGLTGFLDDVRVYNRTLNETEISDIYNSTIPLQAPPFIPPDTTPPDMEVVSPSSGIYNTHSIPLDVSSSAADVDKWFYSLNGGDNTTFTPNITITAVEGYNAIYIYVNDTSGNLNWFIVNFMTDTIAPIITITSPLNITYNTVNIVFGVTASEAVSSWRYSEDGGDNTTFVPFSSTFIAPGKHSILFYANDSFGQEGMAIANFTVNESYSFSAPKITIYSPQNQSYNATSVELKVSSNVTISSSES
jgi:hypothetical protein